MIWERVTSQATLIATELPNVITWKHNFNYLTWAPHFHQQTSCAFQSEHQGRRGPWCVQAQCTGHLYAPSIAPCSPGTRHMVLESLVASTTVQGRPRLPKQISSNVGKPVGSGVAGVRSLWRMARDLPGVPRAASG